MWQKMKDNQKLKKWFCYISLILLFMICSPMIISKFLPNHIQIAQGTIEEELFKWPFKAQKDTNDDLELSLLGYIPIKTVNVEVVKPKVLVPCGNLIGVKVEAEGICVLGTSSFTSGGKEVSPCKNKIEKGDIILEVEHVPLKSKEHFRDLIKENEDQGIMLKVKRREEVMEVVLKPEYCENESSYKLGLWVKDSTQGIGTVTYFDPETKVFGALGHGINDADIKRLLPIKAGEVTKATITAIRKGEKGEPGELKGIIEYTPRNILGNIETNTALGIFGTLNKRGEALFIKNAMPIAYQNEIEEGQAVILSNIIGDEVKAYSIEVRKVARYTSEPAKGMIIEITDPRLLEMTNGIIQGMSGSPIIQNGKLIGAVTHVFIQDPTKGYGIFIENMINNEIK